MTRYPLLDQLEKDFFDIDERIFRALDQGKLSFEFESEIKNMPEYKLYKEK